MDALPFLLLLLQLSCAPFFQLSWNGCSQLDAELTEHYEPSPWAPASCGSAAAAGKGKGRRRWFRLLKNSTALGDPAVAPCYADQLRVVYDRAVTDYRNVARVWTRVVSFGTTRGFGSDDDPSDPERDLCMGRLVEALEKVGYRDGETLFGAPYDFRQAPAAPGKPCRAFSRFRRQLRALVEHASRTNGDQPVILVSHSQGGYFALEFLNRSPMAWRRRHVKHFVMASTGAGGFVLGLQSLVSGVSDASPMGLAGRSLACKFTSLPSPKTRALPVAMNFRAPAVPTTCINGVGVPTTEKLVYWDGDFSQAPEIVYGDGDGVVNSASILALDTVIGEDPRQEYYKSVKIAGTSHDGVVSDGAALERLVSEIPRENFVQASEEDSRVAQL
uniref:Lecithin-cholesterol acyltransferase-like 1 n=1 Tax=Oryza glumipatula TaxID=40148 RepID=A0A0D9ZAS8_9ORYZ